MFIRTKTLSWAAAGVVLAGVAALAPAQAQESVKIGLILPMTGGQASTGKRIDNAVKLYMQQGRHRAGRRSKSS
jgi:branched-chain amino acid transport system substrate-binding protein